MLLDNQPFEKFLYYFPDAICVKDTVDVQVKVGHVVITRGLYASSVQWTAWKWLNDYIEMRLFNTTPAMWLHDHGYKVFLDESADDVARKKLAQMWLATLQSTKPSLLDDCLLW